MLARSLDMMRRRVVREKTTEERGATEGAVGIRIGFERLVLVDL